MLSSTSLKRVFFLMFSSYSVLAIILFYCSVPPVYAGDISGVPRLFADTSTRLPAAAGRVDGRMYQINRDSFALLSTGRAESIVISVAGEDVLFNRASSASRSKTSTWIGQDGSGERSLLMTLGDDHLFARIVSPKGVYIIKPSAEPYAAISYQQDQRYEVPLVDDAVPVPVGAVQPAPEAAADADDGTRIDMLVAYTNGMATAHPGSQIDTRIQYLIDQANLSFQNSGINTRFNLVHSQVYTYPDDSPGDMNEALDDFTDNVGVFAGVEALRVKHGADQATLLRQYVDEGCGLAWLLHSNRTDLSYALVHDGDRIDGSGWFCSDFTYVHEVGHNLGCAHDRGNASVDGWYDYSYGYQEPAGAFRTVMAYDCPGSCPRVAYFSNPNVMYNGKPTGIAAADPLAADNAQTINQTRVGMAGYMPEVIVVPPIVPPNLQGIPLPAIKMMLDK